MAMTALAYPLRPAAPLPGFFADLRAASALFLRRRADRAALARARHVDPRLLEDMGIAAEVPRPVVGGWDDLRPNGMLLGRRA